MYYILDEDKNPVLEEDIDTWIKWMADIHRRCVAKTTMGDQMVCTIFIGKDHNFLESGPPVLFETTVFGGPMNEYQKRCCTWDEAVEIHKKTVESLMKRYYAELV